MIIKFPFAVKQLEANVVQIQEGDLRFPSLTTSQDYADFCVRFGVSEASSDQLLDKVQAFFAQQIIINSIKIET